MVFTAGSRGRPGWSREEEGMIGRARTAMKFFVYGLVVGLLFAPRSGDETREQVLNWVNQTIKDTAGNIAGDNA